MKDDYAKFAGLTEEEDLSDFISNYYLIEQMAEADEALLKKIENTKNQMEYFRKWLNLNTGSDITVDIKQRASDTQFLNWVYPSSITISSPGFNIQSFLSLEVRVQLEVKNENGAKRQMFVSYGASDFDASNSGGVSSIPLNYESRSAYNIQGRIASYQTQIRVIAHFLRVGPIDTYYYYNLDKLDYTTDFTEKIPLTLATNRLKNVNLTLGTTSNIRFWSLPEYSGTLSQYEVPIYTSEIYANQKMVALPIIANGSEILRLKAKQGYNGTLTDVISKYNQNSLRNRFVPLNLSQACNSIITNHFDENENGHITVSWNSLPDVIKLGPLADNGSSNPYYYDWGELYYKTVVFQEGFYGSFTATIKYNYSSYDSTTRTITFTLEPNSWSPVTWDSYDVWPGVTLTILTGISFKVRSFYGNTVTSPESNMLVLEKGTLVTNDDGITPTSVTLSRSSPLTFTGQMAWEGRTGARSKVY